MQTILGKHWHHLPREEIIGLLGSDIQRGLDIFEVKHRRQHFGPNVLTPKKGRGPVIRFLLQFHNPLIYILLAATAITAVLKDVIDAAVIFGAVLVNAIVGYLQESKAEGAIEALAQSMTTEATVTRAGKTERITASELVPGDIVALKAGDKVPADLRLVSSRDIQIAEAVLTGESAAVEKDAEVILAPETIVADRSNMAYTSTLVTYGQGVGIVIATGDATEVGRISQLLSLTGQIETPLTRKIAQFSRQVLFAILIVAAVAFVIEVWRGRPAVEAFTAVIALAVAMIPEGLPAALTVTLAIGVSRMARRRAIIRRLPAVEALGSTTVICSDKTGTLTQNQMTVQHIVVAGMRCEVSGSGYAPIGRITRNGEQIIPAPGSALAETLRAGMLCNDSELVEKSAIWEAHGDPTEAALLVSARKAGISTMLRQEVPRLDLIPFDSEHKYMATLHEAGGGRRVVYIKGAVEVVVEKCASALDSGGQNVPMDTEQIQREVDGMAMQGVRVLAFARSEPSPGKSRLARADVAAGLTFVGLQGMIDPPRPESIVAVRACQQAGVRVKMITGDHALTAVAIARQIGLHGATGGGAQTVVTGKMLSDYADESLIELAEATPVFARVSPEQKLRLVEALQARSHVVAMTGDGVNDGPALKQADIGIAMGITGTDVAKEAADVILTDDNFATIEAAVEEGRGVFDNLTKIIAWTLPTNLGEGLVILVALILGVALPILPLQILWINMTTVATLGVVLALEHREPGIMSRPPRNLQAPILTRELIWRIVLVGALILVGAFGLYEWEIYSGATIAQARTVAVNVVVMVEIFYLFNCRSLTRSMFQIGVFSNWWVMGGIGLMVLLQMLLTYVPPMNKVFFTAPIRLTSWVNILAISLLTYLCVEGEKWIRRRGRSQRP